MAEGDLTKVRIFDRFSQWVKEYKPPHSAWKESTKRTLISDSRRILFTDDCLPGPGYPTAWNKIVKLVPRAEARFGKSIRERFQARKADCT